MAGPGTPSHVKGPGAPSHRHSPSSGGSCPGLAGLTVDTWGDAELLAILGVGSSTRSQSDVL